jgi:predicted transposase YbfD/YdcC
MDGGNESLTEQFKDVKDPRINRTKRHKFIDIIVIAICAVVGGADGFDAIEVFAVAHEEWFRKFLDLPNGIPSHDTFARVFARIDTREFRTSFAKWTKILAGVFASEVIALDGQTMRGARRTGEKKSSIHVVSAWATGLRLVLTQMKVAEKSNEITAIPEVLKLLEIKGCIITMDAMGCQQKIAQQIIDQGGDYVLGLKGNQSGTLSAVEEHFSLMPENSCQQFQHVDKGHGRIETRSHFAVESDSIIDLKEWPGLKSVIKVVSTREIKGEATIEDRYYLSSMPSKSVQTSASAIRSHWGVENNCHYVLDVTFNQDHSRIRKDNAPENMGVLRHMALNILHGAPNAKKSSPSINLKRQRASMDNRYLEKIMSAAGLAGPDI